MYVRMVTIRLLEWLSERLETFNSKVSGETSTSKLYNIKHRGFSRVGEHSQQLYAIPGQIK